MTRATMRVMTTPPSAEPSIAPSAEAAAGLVDVEPAPAKRRRSVTRERLLDAASRVFAQRGIEGATVEEICDRAGFTRGAFYSNFAHKNELVVALLDREEAALFERLGGVVESALGYPNPIEALSQLLFEIAPFGVDNHLLRSELSLLAVRDPELAASYLASQRTFRERFGPFLESGLAAAGLRLTVPAGDAIDTLEAVFEASMRASIVAGRGPNPADTLARRMLPVLLAAISRPAP